MATTTPNYGWSVPTSSDYVAQGAVAIETLGDSVDATLFTALGGAYPGLRLIKKQTIGTTVSSVTVTNAFSAVYDNYKIMVSGGVASVGNNISFKLGAAATNYQHTYMGVVTGGTAIQGYTASDTSNLYAGNGTTNYIDFNMDLNNPFLSKFTLMTSTQRTATSMNTIYCVHQTAASYTDFTMICQAGTLTGGTIYVYGYGAS